MRSARGWGRPHGRCHVSSARIRRRLVLDRCVRAGPRRHPRTRRGGGPGLPRRDVMGPRWVPRRRRLLRPVRLPDHRAAADRVAADREDSPGRLLGTAGATAAAGTAAAHRRRDDRRAQPAASRGDSDCCAATGSPRVFYVANWQMLLDDGDYFAQTAAPSPLEHTWSLAIEEQFYLAVAAAAPGPARRSQATPPPARGVRGRHGRVGARRWPCSTALTILVAPTTAPTPGPRACSSAPPWRPCSRCGAAKPDPSSPA